MLALARDTERIVNSAGERREGEGGGGEGERELRVGGESESRWTQRGSQGPDPAGSAGGGTGRDGTYRRRQKVK